jgi:hypothetical protein
LSNAAALSWFLPPGEMPSDENVAAIASYSAPIVA